MSEKSGDWSYCPACGGGVDTGYECGKCGRDWLEYHQTRSAILAQLTQAQQEIARLRAALEVLANLGGRTSTGNQIAQKALAGTKEGA